MCDKFSVAREKITLKKTFSKKTVLKQIRKKTKNAKRKIRRRRQGKKAYFTMLKRGPTYTRTEELCNSIQQFSVHDVNRPACDVTKLPSEVVEWQKQDQIAYWKSRAISSEIENQMLRQHLRDVYAQQIEYYERSNHQEVNQEIPDTNRVPKWKTNKSPEKVVVEPKKVAPKEPTGKNRLEQLENIYGDMAPKIMGMETAMELNYEKLILEGSPIYWPNIPLKL